MKNDKKEKSNRYRAAALAISAFIAMKQAEISRGSYHEHHVNRIIVREV